MHAWPGLVQPVPYMNGIVDCSTSTTFSFGGGTWDDLHCKCLDPIQAAFQRLPTTAQATMQHMQPQQKCSKQVILNFKVQQ